MTLFTKPHSRPRGDVHQRRTLLPSRQACYKCNMRRWMRDRSKRRKQEPDKQGQENPAPLQPKFPDSDEGNGEQPELAEHPQELGNQPESTDFEPAVQVSAGGEEPPQPQVRRERSRRRGRRGRGNRPQAPAQAPALPRPGGPTGEAAEAAETGELAEAGESGGVAAQAATQPAQPSRKPKGAVVLSIGLPGSGKSTWFKRHNILPLSSDMVRILLFDDVTEQRYQDLVFSTLRAMLRARLLARRPWNYVDATNLSPHERRSWVKLAHDFGYEAHAVFFDVPPEVCIERNRRRERNVPEDVMQRMASKLRPPKFEEGFAKITVVRLKKTGGESGSSEEPPHELAVGPDEGEPPNEAEAES